MKLYLIRHAESEANKIGNIYQGHLDTSLSNHGHKQAKKLAEIFSKNNYFDLIYSSDLNRSVQTTNYLQKFHYDKKIIFDDRLRERDHGKFTGKNRSEKLYEKLKEKDILLRKAKYGENYFEHRDRINDFLEEVIGNNKSCVIVNHGGSLRIMLEIFLNKIPSTYYENSNYKINNCEYYEFQIKPKIKLLSNNKFLQNMDNQLEKNNCDIINKE
jgi:broad specificity phosphatase PhoE